VSRWRGQLQGAGDEFDIATLRRELDGDGLGHPPSMARRQGLHAPVVVFVRGDGWSLGASERIEGSAFDTWAGLWTLFARESEGWRLRPISEYRGGAK